MSDIEEESLDCRYLPVSGYSIVIDRLTASIHILHAMELGGKLGNASRVESQAEHRALESRRDTTFDKDSMPADILKAVGSFRTLEQAMLWAFARKPPAQLVNVVTQDEFTHDVVISVAPDAFLVFDTT